MEQSLCSEAGQQNPSPFTEPECSLPPSQNPTTSPCAESDKPNPSLPAPYLLETYFNTILPSITWFSKKSLPFGYSEYEFLQDLL